MRKILGALAMLFVGSALAADVAPPPHVRKPPLVEGFDAIAFAPHRPIRLRLKIRYAGKPLADRWLESLRTAYKGFDRNGDGWLDGKEVQNILTDGSLAQLIQSGFYAPVPDNLPTLEKLDSNLDGRVSFPEFAAYYQLAAARASRSIPPNFESPFNAQTTEAIFKLIDRDGDDRLSQTEVETMKEWFVSKDGDEDECLSLNELAPNSSRRQQQPTRPSVPRSIVVFQAGQIPTSIIAERVVKDYDQDKDGSLSLRESGFDAATFASLDANRDGKLNAAELDRWRTGPPDLEATLSLGTKPADCRAIIDTDAKLAAGRGFTFSTVDPGRVIVRHGRQPIELWAFAFKGPDGRGNSIRQVYAQQFKQLAGAKGYVTDKDFTAQIAIQFQQLRVIVEPADFDGDGKLTMAELDKFFEMQQPFVDLGVSLVPMVQTPTLFQLLDENRDGRLGLRELRTAWRRLSSLEPPRADGSPTRFVTRAAIQPTISLRLSRSIDRGFVSQQVYYANPGGVRVPEKGPIWFRKMDRNADGDLSRLEFLGTRAEFDAIDADRDGLISLAEAEAWEKKARREK